MILEIIKLISYSGLIVLVSKYILVEVLRKIAENLNLKARTVGNIAGISTSTPELFTISISSIRGLSNVSIFNILSSNIINLLQYLLTIVVNKNAYKLTNTAIKTDLILVLLTIIIPILLLKFNIQINIAVIPLFIVLYLFFNFLNTNIHKVYLRKEDLEIEKSINIETRLKKQRNIKIIKYIIVLIFTTILLFVISENLGNNLEILCNIFNIPQVLIGIILGTVTSIPELITFFESQKHHKKVHNDILGVVEATNNLLTSNMINLFIIHPIGIVLTNIFFLMK